MDKIIIIAPGEREIAIHQVMGQPALFSVDVNNSFVGYVEFDGNKFITALNSKISPEDYEIVKERLNKAFKL